jgi:hypothetical protein
MAPTTDNTGKMTCSPDKKAVPADKANRQYSQSRQRASALTSIYWYVVSAAVMVWMQC